MSEFSGGDGNNLKQKKITRRKILKTAVIGAGVFAGASVFARTSHALERSESPDSSRDNKPETTVDKTPEKIKLHLHELIAAPPDIGGQKNYRIPLHEGIGWATYEFAESSQVMGENLINRVQYHIAPRLIEENREPTPWENMMIKSVNASSKKDPTIVARYFCEHFLVTSQSNLSPNEALASGKVVGTIATREGADRLGKPYLVWSMESPNNSPHFIGVVLNVDNSGNWDHHQNWRYSVGEWNNSGYDNQGLQWMIDASYNLKSQLIPAKEKAESTKSQIETQITGRGEPGIILLSREKYLELLEHKADNAIPSSDSAY